ncbi:hypothetical protein Hanom_Chr07g00608901 [Helianthus anomalus]
MRSFVGDARDDKDGGEELYEWWQRWVEGSGESDGLVLGGVVLGLIESGLRS